MTKEDIKKAVLTGIVGGFTAALSLLLLVWAFVKITDWYNDYQRQKENERIESTLPDRRSGSRCPECRSTNVAQIVYGYPAKGWGALAEDKKSNFHGCFLPMNPKKYHCNDCKYEWGSFRKQTKSDKCARSLTNSIANYDEAVIWLL